MAEEVSDAAVVSKQGSPSQKGELEKGSNPIPPIKITETGFTGLSVVGGKILEECSWELRWPHCIETFKKMEKDGTIAPALELVEMMIARAGWVVKIPEGYEEQLKDKARFLRQNMDDMDQPWSTFIKQASTFNRYGFCVNEKVYRYRRKSNGSKYDDGLIGIHKLPIRSQDSIKGWVYSKNGRTLQGLVQEVELPSDSSIQGSDFLKTQSTGAVGSEIVEKRIPRHKFLLFRNNPLKDSPEGRSPLISAWQNWKYRQAYMESEALSTAQDANGFKVLYLPQQYLIEDATPEDKEVLKMYQRMMANAHQAKQSGFILPLVRDSAGDRMFEFDIKSVTGNKSNDTNAIISRYTSEILVSLFADMLALGNSGSGSFSLSESKMSIVEMGIQAKLDEIKSQLNHDLVPQLFELNGWDTDVLPYFDYGEVGKESMDELSKYFQRTAAAGLIPKTPAVINHVLAKGGFDYRVDEDMSQEELEGVLSPETTRSGDGMSKASGNGTSDEVAKGDNSVSNNEN